MFTSFIAVGGVVGKVTEGIHQVCQNSSLRKKAHLRDIYCKRWINKSLPGTYDPCVIQGFYLSACMYEKGSQKNLIF